MKALLLRMRIWWFTVRLERHRRRFERAFAQVILQGCKNAQKRLEGLR